MIPTHEIKSRALMMAITTGNMPDVDFILAVQKSEHQPACFGQGQSCTKERSQACRWRKECLALDHFADVKFPRDVSKQSH